MALLKLKWVGEPIFYHDLMVMRGDGFFYRDELELGLARWAVFDDGKNVQLSFSCPSGCKGVHQLPVYRGENGYGWRWDGNPTRPTLQPSIQILAPCKWHGFVERGYFCNDRSEVTNAPA